MAIVVFKVRLQCHLYIAYVQGRWCDDDKETELEVAATHLVSSLLTLTPIPPPAVPPIVHLPVKLKLDLSRLIILY